MSRAKGQKLNPRRGASLSVAGETASAAEKTKAASRRLSVDRKIRG
jgi:hypothetical protein